MDRSVGPRDLNTLYLQPHKRGKVNVMAAIFLTAAEFTGEDAAACLRCWRQIKLFFFLASLLIYHSLSVSVCRERPLAHTRVLARKLL